jgi:hypothetical protein
MDSMLAIVPDPLPTGSVVVADGNDDGMQTDISVSVGPLDGDEPFTVRTLLRSGTQISPSGVVHGVATDAVAIAHLAVASLLLQAIPSGQPSAETRSAMKAVESAADTLARDHNRWSFRAMDLGGVSYALGFRVLGQGFVAHADLGDCVVAAWGTGSLPSRLKRVQRIDSTSLPRPD